MIGRSIAAGGVRYSDVTFTKAVSLVPGDFRIITSPTTSSVCHLRATRFSDQWTKEPVDGIDSVASITSAPVAGNPISRLFRQLLPGNRRIRRLVSISVASDESFFKMLPIIR